MKEKNKSRIITRSRKVSKKLFKIFNLSYIRTHKHAKSDKKLCINEEKFLFTHQISITAQKDSKQHK